MQSRPGFDASADLACARSASLLFLQVMALNPGGEAELLATLEEQPSYEQVLRLAESRPGGKAGMTWVERIQSEFTWNQKSLTESVEGNKPPRD